MPADQVDAVKIVIDNRPELGYRSPGDFYRDAAREKLRDLYNDLPTTNY